ncbi:MAG: terminase family protein [archaeon]
MQRVRGNWSVKPLSRIINTLYTNGNKSKIGTPLHQTNHGIPLLQICDFEKKENFISPYILGCLLADGCLSLPYEIIFSTTDIDILHRINKELLYEYTTRKKSNNDKDINYNICKKQRNGNGSTNLYLDEIKKLELFGLKSYTKYIPNEYIFNSKENRIALLQGLMDCDGCISGLDVFYTTVSEKLVDDVCFVVRSLGGTANVSQGKTHSKSYVISINLPKDICPFYLPRKKDKYLKIKDKKKLFRRIKEIKYIGEEETQCITVSGKEGLYLTDDFIVTHNSETLLSAALQYIDTPGYNAVLIRDSYQNLSKPDALIDRSFKWLYNTDAHWDGDTRTWKFPSGSTLSFGHMDGAKAHFSYQSSQYQFVGIDEVVAIPENQAIYLLSRLRRLETNKHIPIRFRCASNPPTREQLSTGSWVKTRYVDPKTRKAGTVFIPAWMDDNPYLDKEEYRKSLANLDPITRAQLEKGDWEISARGRLFERQWFSLVNRVKDVVKKRIRYWDLAATEISKKNKDPDYTSGTLMCITDKNEYFIEHITRFREKPATVEANILKWANLDGRDTCIWIEQEPGSSGKSVIDHYVRDVLPGFIIKGQQARENKITRSELLASKAEQGLVYMVKGKWNDEFLEELDVFPDGLHEDQCFIAGTKIATLFGNKNIEDIKVGDLLITPLGISKVTQNGKTGEQKVVSHIGLIGTFNHPIFNKNKNTFVNLIDINVKDIDIITLKGLIRWKYLKLLNLMEQNTNSCVEKKDIISVNQQVMKKESVLKDCMLQFLNFILEKRYQKAMKFIIRMVILLIMTTLIWSVYCGGNIAKNILLKIKKNSLDIYHIFKIWQKNGINQKKEESGIKNIGSIVLEKLNIKNLYVCFVENILNQNMLTLSVVQNIAEKNTMKELENIKKLKNVLFVEKNLKQYKESQKEKHVQKSVDGFQCRIIVEKKKVYNLETKDHVYYANNILVHNCDSTSGAFSKLSNKSSVKIAFFG